MAVAATVLCPGGVPSSDPITNPLRDCDLQQFKLQGGNANLSPEKSKSFSFGAVMEPTPALTLTADYFNIKLKDKIDSLPEEIIYGNFAKYQERVAEMRAAIQRKEADIGALRREMAKLPLAEKLARLRDPAVRAQLLSEDPKDGARGMVQAWDQMHLMAAEPDYEPTEESTVAFQARARGLSNEAVALDHMLSQDGKGMLYVPFLNYADGNLDARAQADMAEELARIGAGLRPFRSAGLGAVIDVDRSGLGGIAGPADLEAGTTDRSPGRRTGRQALEEVAAISAAPKVAHIERDKGRRRLCSGAR